MQPVKFEAFCKFMNEFSVWFEGDKNPYDNCSARIKKFMKDYGVSSNDIFDMAILEPNIHSPYINWIIKALLANGLRMAGDQIQDCIVLRWLSAIVSAIGENNCGIVQVETTKLIFKTAIEKSRSVILRKDNFMIAICNSSEIINYPIWITFMVYIDEVGYETVKNSEGKIIDLSKK